MSDLVELIQVVNTKVATATPPDLSRIGGWDQWEADGARIVQELRDEHGARVRLDREPATMVMAGIKASATGGWKALLGNWVHAARRRIVS